MIFFTLTNNNEMKHKLLWAMAALLSIVGGSTASAQTDVTSQYLTNAGFDNSDNYVTGTVATVAGSNGGNYQTVTGWTNDEITNSGSWYAGGVFQINSGYAVGGDDYVAPTADADGETTGGMLGLAGAWGASVGYYQNVTLPAGLYRISYKVYNAGSNLINNYTNTIGFVEDGGTTHYADMELYSNEWAEGVIYLDLSASTSGKIHVGYSNDVSTGSNATPKIFVDYIKIEAYNPSLGYAIEDKTSSVGTSQASWGGTGTYTPSTDNVMGAEKFLWANSLSVGEQQSQTISSLSNGTYQISVYAAASSTSSRDNTSYDLTDYATTYTSFHANSSSHGIPAYDRTAFSKYDRIELNDVSVTDGTLKMYMNEDVLGPNWLVIQIKKLLYLNTSAGATVSYGSGNFPISADATSVTQDYWYAYTVPVSSDYTITATDAVTVYYTQDGTQDASSGTYTSLSLSANNAETIALSAGTLYIKASAATTLTVAASSYSYNVGSATADVSYVQKGNTVTVTFADLATNNSSATLTTDFSSVTFGGSSVTCTATTNGFTFTVPSVTANSSYDLVIPADAIYYTYNDTKQESNAAQTITLKTPAIFDGTYYLQTSEYKYVGRGGSWNTQVIVNDWGLPLNVATDATGVTTLQYYDTDFYVYLPGDGTVYGDVSTTDTRTSFTLTANNDGTYYIQPSSASTTYLTVSNSALAVAETAYSWTIQEGAAHKQQMSDNKDSQAKTAAGNISSLSSSVTSVSTLESAVTDWYTNDVISASSVTSTPSESYQTAISYDATVAVYSDTVTISTDGLYKFTIQAFGRLRDNDKVYALQQQDADVSPYYAYFGDVKMPLMSVMDMKDYTESVTDFVQYGDYYYPNGTASALTAFQAGKYENDIWVYLTAGDYTYGIAIDGNPRNGNANINNARWCCYTTESISLTRYSDTPSSGTDVTSKYIINPGFEDDAAEVSLTTEGNSIAGWTASSTSTVTGVYSTSGGYAAKNSTGSYLFHTEWQGVPLTQDIGTLPAGTYLLQADVATGDDQSSVGTVFLTATNGSNSYTSTGYVSSTDAVLNTEYLAFISDGTNTTTIGIIGGRDATVNSNGSITKGATDDAGYWHYTCDNFKLTYLGSTADELASWLSTIATANAPYSDVTDVSSYATNYATYSAYTSSNTVAELTTAISYITNEYDDYCWVNASTTHPVELTDIVIRGADCTSNTYWEGNGRSTASVTYYDGTTRTVFTGTYDGAYRNQTDTIPYEGAYLLRTYVRPTASAAYATISLGTASTTTSGVQTGDDNIGNNWAYNDVYYYQSNTDQSQTISITLSNANSSREADCGEMHLYYVGRNVDYEKDATHYYLGTYATAPTVELTDDVPVANTEGATFTSGTATFTNPNGLIFAASDQFSTTQNIVVDGTCATLSLVKGHPFVNPTSFTATTATYTVSTSDLAGYDANNTDATYYATLMLPFNASMPTGKVYTLDQDVIGTGSIYATAVSTTLPANTPVLITGEGQYEGSSVTIPVIASGATYTNGHLTGVYSATTAPVGSYVLQNHTDGQGVAFYLVNGTQPTVNPFRAYFTDDSSVKAVNVIFDDEDETTAISTVDGGTPTEGAEVYSLSGVRQQSLQKGVNIVRMKDGSVKKVFVK